MAQRCEVKKNAEMFIFERKRLEGKEDYISRSHLLETIRNSEEYKDRPMLLQLINDEPSMK